NRIITIQLSCEGRERKAGEIYFLVTVYVRFDGVTPRFIIHMNRVKFAAAIMSYDIWLVVGEIISLS
ncbi:TPA: hypothetical protein ACH9RO_004737, partial [Escherichia coli]